MRRRGLEIPSPEAIAAGIQPHPERDLLDRGGKVIHDLTYKTFFIGGESVWNVKCQEH